MASVNKWEDFRQRRTLVSSRFISLKYRGSALKSLITFWYTHIFIKTIYRKYRDYRVAVTLKAAFTIHRMVLKTRRKINTLEE